MHGFDVPSYLLGLSSHESGSGSVITKTISGYGTNISDAPGWTLEDFSNAIQSRIEIETNGEDIETLFFTRYSKNPSGNVYKLFFGVVPSRTTEWYAEAELDLDEHTIEITGVWYRSSGDWNEWYWYSWTLSSVVNVSGGGGSIVLSGDTDPSALIGNDEDLYIKYMEMDPSFDHTYAIAATYRKVSGVWTAYTNPVGPAYGVRVYTDSSSGVYCQVGSVDGHGNFIPERDPAYYTRADANEQGGGVIVNGRVKISYYSSGWWILNTVIALTNGTNNYAAGARVTDWKSQIDVTLWEVST